MCRHWSGKCRGCCQLLQVTLQREGQQQWRRLWRRRCGSLTERRLQFTKRQSRQLVLRVLLRVLLLMLLQVLLLCLEVLLVLLLLQKLLLIGQWHAEGHKEHGRGTVAGRRRVVLLIVAATVAAAAVSVAAGVAVLAQVPSCSCCCCCCCQSLTAGSVVALQRIRCRSNLTRHWLRCCCLLQCCYAADLMMLLPCLLLMELLLLCLLQARHGQMLIALPTALAVRAATGCCRRQTVVAVAAAAIVAAHGRQHVGIALGSGHAGVAHFGCLAWCSCLLRGRPRQRVRQNAHKAQSHGGTGCLSLVLLRYLGGRTSLRLTEKKVKVSIQNQENSI